MNVFKDHHTGTTVRIENHSGVFLVNFEQVQCFSVFTVHFEQVIEVTENK